MKFGVSERKAFGVVSWKGVPVSGAGFTTLDGKLIFTVEEPAGSGIYRVDDVNVRPGTEVIVKAYGYAPGRSRVGNVADFVEVLLDTVAPPVAGYPGWSQKFDKVHDLLELRVGGPLGTLISWPDRGRKGRYTWAIEDGKEIRDLTPWVRKEYKIKLWARILRDSARPSGDHQCDMDTLYNGTRRQRWEFDGCEDHEIRQP